MPFLSRRATKCDIEHSEPGTQRYCLYFRLVLKIELGDFARFERAKKPKRLPVVLSKEEVRRLLEVLSLDVQVFQSGFGFRAYAPRRLKWNDLRKAAPLVIPAVFTAGIQPHGKRASRRTGFRPRTCRNDERSGKARIGAKSGNFADRKLEHRVSGRQRRPIIFRVADRYDIGCYVPEYLTRTVP